MYKSIKPADNNVETHSTKRENRTMIKGVTKSIIEINPRNACFEKIIVILNSNCDVPDKDEIKRQAELMTSTAPEYLKRQRRLYRLKLAVSAVSGAFLTAISFGLLYLFV